MSKILKILCLLVLGAASELSGNGSVENWTIVRENVATGGCVIVIINLDYRLASRLEIQIDDRDPIRLVDKAGLAVRRDDKTVVLLSHDLFNPALIQGTEGAQVVQIPPIFDRPGQIGLTLQADGVSYGTKVVTVVAAPPEAREANELIYPEADMNQGVRDPASLTWMQLILKDSFGLTPPLTDEEIHQLREQLPIIMKHPDWAEIAEMSVARLEAELYRESITIREGDNRRIKDEFTELPPPPDIVTRCLRAKPTNPYVQAIQERVRGPITDLRLMDAQRRGEDINEILKAMSKKNNHEGE